MAYQGFAFAAAWLTASALAYHLDDSSSNDNMTIVDGEITIHVVTVGFNGDQFYPNDITVGIRKL